MKFNDDGSISVRQSWLSDFVMDPERARLSMLHPELDRDSDVAALGTGVHKAIESYLDGTISLRDVPEFARETNRLALTEMDIHWIDLDEVRFVEHAGHLAKCWVDQLSPYVPLGGVSELKFSVPFGEIRHPLTGEMIVLKFNGTIDYVTHDINRFGLWDWKTSGRTYAQWEKQRWAIQPSVYCEAVHLLGELGLLPGGPEVRADYPIEFNYGVMVRKERSSDRVPFAVEGSGQKVPVTRFAGHGTWIKDQAMRAVAFCLAADSEQPWPTIDSHGLCSEKWCPWWALCKGSHISGQELTWKPQ